MSTMLASFNSSKNAFYIHFAENDKNNLGYVQVLVNMLANAENTIYPSIK